MGTGHQRRKHQSPVKLHSKLEAFRFAALLLSGPGNGGEFAVFVGFNLFAGLIGLPGHRPRPHGLTQ